MGGKNLPWTEERKALVTELWLSGKSATECAAILGEGATRNAVIGQVTRMKLPKHASKATRSTTTSLMNKARKTDALPKPPKPIKAAAADRQKDRKVVPMLTRISHAHDEPAPITVRGRAWEPLRGSEPIPLSRLHPDHHEGMCRWPVGELREGTFAYCGLPSVKSSELTFRPYCYDHEHLSRRTV